jgi:hypothetical protein
VNSVQQSMISAECFRSSRGSRTARRPASRFTALVCVNGCGRWFQLPIIGALLGHKNAATTARYEHLASDPLRAANDARGSKNRHSLADRIYGRAICSSIEGFLTPVRRQFSNWTMKQWCEYGGIRPSCGPKRYRDILLAAQDMKFLLSLVVLAVTLSVEVPAAFCDDQIEWEVWPAPGSVDGSLS